MQQRAKVITAVDRLFGAGDGPILKFSNREDVFITLAGDSGLVGAGVFRLESLKVQLSHLVHRAGGAVAVRLIGPADKIAVARELLSGLGLALASATATSARADIFVYPAENRVRLSTDAVAPAPARSQAVAPKRIKVAIVDDSKTIQMLLKKIFASDDRLEVVWAATRPSEALELLDKVRPDVLTLDLHMPEMNGVELLRAYIGKYPIPTVIISSLNKDESPLVLDALEGGAVDYIQKPDAKDLGAVQSLILEKVRDAAQAKVIRPRRRIGMVARLASGLFDQRCVVAIGASTGGTEALKDVLVQLPEAIPPIVIVQHIPPVFSLAFANRLNGLCPFEVKEAEDGDAVRPGRVLIAPGGFQMALKRGRTGLEVAILDTDPVNRHKPSVDVLFDSVAQILGPSAVGVILTGMGADGAKGLLRMKEAGARTVAQDEASCVVFGMPREAIRLGAADEICSLTDVPQTIMRLVRVKQASKPAAVG